MLDDVDNFPGGIRIVDDALVSQAPQLSKGSHKLLKDGFRHIRSIPLEHLKLCVGFGVVNCMAAKNVT
jgi:hypothetical protein